MATPIYLTSNNCKAHATATVTATPGTATGYTATDVVNENPAVGWRSSATLVATNTQRIDMDMGAALSTGLDFVALFGLKGASDTTIKLLGDDAATFNSDAGNPQESVDLSWDGSSESIYKSGFGFGTNTRRYWAVEWTYGAVDGTPELGELFLGTGVTLSRSPAYPVPVSGSYPTVVHRTQGGQEFSYPLDPGIRLTFDLVWKNLSTSERNEMLAMAGNFKGHRTGALVISPGDADTTIIGVPYCMRSGIAWEWSDDINHTFRAHRFRAMTAAGS